MSEAQTGLADRFEKLVGEVVVNNRWRQSRAVNLIPSEMTPSLLVRLLEIADTSGRYAEHRKIDGEEVYYYQGIDFIRSVEEQCREQLRTYFDCANVELRPISGQMANEIVFKALVRSRLRRQSSDQPRLRRVANNALTLGGHLSAQPMGALFNYVERDAETRRDRVTNIPVLTENPYRADVPALLELLDERRPDLIVFGKSMFLYPEPVAEVVQLIADWEERPVILYDMAHVLGLYGAFQSPFEDGADLVTGSTHKTFFGPQRGVVAGNLTGSLEPLWTQIENRAFPGSTSNHHLGTLLGLLAATYEMNAYREDYQSQVLGNARAFAASLHDLGVTVQGDAADGYTHTHQVVCRVSAHGTGDEIAHRLERNHIIVNYQALPDDSSFATPSGIRLGVAEMTRYGMGPQDFGELAELIADVILHDVDVAEQVSALRARFVTMEFCLPNRQALELGAGLLGSLLPGAADTEMLAEALQRGVSTTGMGP